MSTHKKHLIDKLILLRALSLNKNMNSTDTSISINKEKISTKKFDEEVLLLGKNPNLINYNVKYTYTSYVIQKGNSYVLNYNLSDEEKAWINFNNMVVLPWTFLSKSMDNKLYEFISLLLFEKGMYTFIDENIKDQFLDLINRINLKIIT